MSAHGCASHARLAPTPQQQWDRERCRGTAERWVPALQPLATLLPGPPCSYTMFATAPLVLDTSTLLTTAISNYIQAFSPINITTDGRIINCAQNGTNPLCTGAPAAVPAPPSAAVASGWGSWAWLVAASVVAALLL